CSLESMPCEKSFAGSKREADPILPWGRPMTSWKKQVRAHGVPPGYGVQHPSTDSRITSGSCRGQQGLVTTCKDSPTRPKAEEGESPTGAANEPVRAKKEG